MSQFKWNGVFPAITTQMTQDGSINYEGTAKHTELLIQSGIHGMIYLGSLGENQTMTPEEKRQTMREMVNTVGGRIPVVAGVAEASTADAVRFVKDCEAIGVDGFMVMPSMLYRGAPDETLAHFTTVAKSTSRSIMIYNNPIAYFNDVTSEMFKRLGDLPNVQSLKESSGDTRRVTDLRNALGDRFAIFTGVDNLFLECAVLGIDGWVAGTGIAFPMENQYLWELTRAGRWEEARKIYRWFTPLLHLDVHTKFVQYIKLCCQECGIGTEWTRAPRLPLVGPERERVLKIIHDGIANRPGVPSEWKPRTWS